MVLDSARHVLQSQNLSKDLKASDRLGEENVSEGGSGAAVGSDLKGFVFSILLPKISSPHFLCGPHSRTTKRQGSGSMLCAECFFAWHTLPQHPSMYLGPSPPRLLHLLKCHLLNEAFTDHQLFFLTFITESLEQLEK